MLAGRFSPQMRADRCEPGLNETTAARLLLLSQEYVLSASAACSNVLPSLIMFPAGCTCGRGLLMLLFYDCIVQVLLCWIRPLGSRPLQQQVAAQWFRHKRLDTMVFLR